MDEKYFVFRLPKRLWEHERTIVRFMVGDKVEAIRKWENLFPGDAYNDKYFSEEFTIDANL